MAQLAVGHSLEDVLRRLLDIVDGIFHGQVINPENYILYYTLVYDYCTSSRMAIAESDLLKIATGRREYLLKATTDGRQIRPGGELYYNIEKYLMDYVENLCRFAQSLEKENLLRFYMDQWQKYHLSSDKLNGIFCSLNRHWISAANGSDHKSIYEIFTLAKLIWRKLLWKPLKDKLIDACFNSIDLCRHNQVTEIELIEKFFKSYEITAVSNFRGNMPIRFDDPELAVLGENIYENYFSQPFIRNTEKFYQSQSVFDIEHGTILKYLEKITPYVNKDIEDIYPYLFESTQIQMMEMINRIFFNNHLSMIYNQADISIKEENIQNLKIIYQSIKHLPNIKNNIANKIEEHFYQIAMATMEHVKDNDPKIYIETVIDIHKKFLKLVQEAFSGEQGFTAVLDKVCGKFINNNAVTQAAGTTTKSPELLARYCDALLRKGNKAVEETDLEEKFNQIMIIFNYIEDKDVFLKYYEKMLSKRLFGQLSTSDDYEESMISKLKQACGFGYTSKLQRMFQDIGVSKTLIIEYEKYCETHHVTGIVDFSVMVLSSNIWPFSIPQTFVLPIELQSTFDSFTDFYTHRHNGRKLTWLHQHSKGELQTFFTSQKYILQVSTYQMVVLLLFNKVLTWTVERIQDETQIKLELLLQVLLGLLKSRLLVCPDITEDEQIKTSYSIQLATDFNSKKLRINLNVPLKAVEQKDIEGIHRTIDEDRKMVIQAAIVRIMKARQTLKHALLMQEVIQQLNSRFRPKIPVIKKCIDNLIEKEYLERQSNEKDVLRYLN